MKHETKGPRQRLLRKTLVILDSGKNAYRGNELNTSMLCTNPVGDAELMHDGYGILVRRRKLSEMVPNGGKICKRDVTRAAANEPLGVGMLFSYDLKFPSLWK